MEPFPLPGEQNELLTIRTLHNYYKNPVTESIAHKIHALLDEDNYEEACIRYCKWVFMGFYYLFLLVVSSIPCIVLIVFLEVLKIRHLLYNLVLLLSALNLFIVFRKKYFVTSAILLWLLLLTLFATFAFIGRSAALQYLQLYPFPVWILSIICSYIAFSDAIKTATFGSFLVEPYKKSLKITHRVFTRKVNKKRLASVAICGLCRGRINDRLVILKCHPEHIFHQNCVETFLSKLEVCPRCKLTHKEHRFTFFTYNNSLYDLTSKTVLSVTSRWAQVFYHENSLYVINRNSLLMQVLPGERRLLREISTCPDRGIVFPSRAMHTQYRDSVYFLSYMNPQLLTRYGFRTSNWFPLIAPRERISQLRCISHYLFGTSTRRGKLILQTLDILDQESGWTDVKIDSEGDLAGVFDCGNNAVLLTWDGRVDPILYRIGSKTFRKTKIKQEKDASLSSLPEKAVVADCNGSKNRFYIPREGLVSEFSWHNA